jgi:Tfp pilus assembly protein PilE
MKKCGGDIISLKSILHKKSQELGRSMIEMLGVLAIAGVLSIGGFTGYSMAMTSYR